MKLNFFKSAMNILRTFAEVKECEQELATNKVVWLQYVIKKYHCDSHQLKELMHVTSHPVEECVMDPKSVA